MQSIAYIPGSDGVANASLMTISTVRAPLASTILVNTVANVPDKFYASMGTPNTFTDPITSETITVISEATAVDFAGHIDSGHLEIDAIAPGYTDTGSKVGDIVIIRPITEWANNVFNILSESMNDNGELKNTSLNPFLAVSEISGDYVVAGTGVIALSAGLVGTFSNITYYIGALKYTKSSIANKTYTVSKDTYVFIDTAGTITYTEVANNAAAPATPANNVLVAIVVTSGSAITRVTLRSRGGVKSTDVDPDSFYYEYWENSGAVGAPGEFNMTLVKSFDITSLPDGAIFEVDVGFSTYDGGGGSRTVAVQITYNSISKMSRQLAPYHISAQTSIKHRKIPGLNTVEIYFGGTNSAGAGAIKSTIARVA